MEREREPILAVCDSAEGCGFVYPSGTTTGEAWWVDAPADRACPVCGREGHIPETWDSLQAALDALTEDQGGALVALLVLVAVELDIDPAEIEDARRSILSRGDTDWVNVALNLTRLIVEVLHR
jgi:hypothetical protein